MYKDKGMIKGEQTENIEQKQKKAANECTKEKSGEKTENIDAIYIHIPFCTKKCGYCDFCTFINMSHEYEKYVQALIEEIKLHPPYKYDTVYFGGGTPSLFSYSQIYRIMENLNIKEGGEVTLEMNPEGMSRTKLEKLKKIGINRLSIGTQSFQDSLLKSLGREHTGEDAERIFKEARDAGFNNISIDLMFSIPDQTMEDLKRDLNKLIELSPENISIYSLIWEEGTVFWSKLQKGHLKETDEDFEAEMYEYIIDFLKENGYIHYEISNFSKKGLSGKHNTKYWKNKEFIGVGLSAASYYNQRRYSNTRIFSKYYESIRKKEHPIDESTLEIIDSEEKGKLEKMLGLRLIHEGIEYAPDNVIETLLSKGLIEKVILEGSPRIRLSRRGILLANEVFMEFI